MTISVEARRAFVAGASMALKFAKVPIEQTAEVMQKMLITADEIHQETMRTLKEKGTGALN